MMWEQFEINFLLRYFVWSKFLDILCVWAGKSFWTVWNQSFASIEPCEALENDCRLYFDDFYWFLMILPNRKASSRKNVRNLSERDLYSRFSLRNNFEKTIKQFILLHARILNCFLVTIKDYFYSWAPIGMSISKALQIL